jgi:hypothetical protein
LAEGIGENSTVVDRNAPVDELTGRFMIFPAREVTVAGPVTYARIV